MSIDAVFAQFFDNIHDPRQHAKIYYPFYDVTVHRDGVDSTNSSGNG